MNSSRRTLRWLNVAAFALLFGLMLSRGRPYSQLYIVAVAVAGAVLLAGLLSAVTGRTLWPVIPPARMSGRMRAAGVILPWLVLYVVILATSWWWSQQFWPLRLFVLYVLALWTIGCLLPPTDSARIVGNASDTSPERLVAPVLMTMAAALGALAIDGLAFGVTSFGVSVSALFAVLAALGAAVARFASPSRRSAVLRNAFGLLFGLIVVEAGIRVLHLGESLQEVDNPEYVRLFHHITPPKSAYLSQPKPLDEFPAVLVETNSLGIRGPEIPPGPVDLMLIGDSMIEARQLAWEETLSARLPAAFAARSAPVRVVGQGVRGWAPLLEWNWYLKAGRKLQPRTVLLFFFWNDLWTAGDEVRTFQAVMKPDGRPDYFNVVVERSWVWYKHVRAVRLAENMLQRVGPAALKRTLSLVGSDRSGVDEQSAEATARRMAKDSLLSPAEIDQVLTRPFDQLSPRLQQVARTEFWPSTRPLALWTDTQREAAAKTESEFRMFAEDVSADGGRLVIVHVPNAYQIAPTECSVARYLVGLDGDRVLPEDSGIQQWLREVTARHGIELLDPSAAMREYHRTQPAPAPPLFLRADCHWTARGHQLMAEFLADWYLRQR
jgi:hypothetical protein